MPSLPPSVLIAATIAGAWIPVMHRLAWIFSRPSLSANERIEFFPTHGYQPDPLGNPDLWEVRVGGVVYGQHWGEAALVRGIVNLAGYWARPTAEEGDLLAHRLGFFTRDFNRGKRVEVTVDRCGRLGAEGAWGAPALSSAAGAAGAGAGAGATGCRGLSAQAWAPDGPSGADGAFWGTLSLEAAGLRPGDFVTFWAGATDKEDADAAPRFWSEARLVGSSAPGSGAAVALISDIDDTIRETGVGNTSAVVRSTFLQPFKAAPGAAGIYRMWAEQAAALRRAQPLRVHYLSGSPWQLQAELKGWMWGPGAAARPGGPFPYGSFHLKSIRLELLEPWGLDASMLRLVASPLEFKMNYAREIFARSPNTQFLLVGDSGEKDPEIYGQLYREFPSQVACIMIREVSNHGMGPAREGEAFLDVPSQNWMVFRDYSELERQKVKSMSLQQSC